MQRRLLIGLDGFAAVACQIGMVLCLTGLGYRFPEWWLEDTPFSSYAIPGLILGVGVGGSAFVAMVAMIRKPRLGAVLSVVAGGVMMGWIVGEIILVPPIRFTFYDSSTWQQGLYFLVGVAMAVFGAREVSASTNDGKHVQIAAH